MSTERYVLVKKVLTNWLNIELPQQACVVETVYAVEQDWLFGNEKVPVAAASRKD